MKVFWEVGRVGAEDDNQMEGFRPQCVGDENVASSSLTGTARFVTSP